jgi:hypothetical protein
MTILAAKNIFEIFPPKYSINFPPICRPSSCCLSERSGDRRRHLHNFLAPPFFQPSTYLSEGWEGDDIYLIVCRKIYSKRFPQKNVLTFHPPIFCSRPAVCPKEKGTTFTILPPNTARKCDTSRPDCSWPRRGKDFPFFLKAQESK